MELCKRFGHPVNDCIKLNWQVKRSNALGPNSFLGKWRMSTCQLNARCAEG